MHPLEVQACLLEGTRQLLHLPHLGALQPSPGGHFLQFILRWNPLETNCSFPLTTIISLWPHLKGSELETRDFQRLEEFFVLNGFLQWPQSWVFSCLHLDNSCISLVCNKVQFRGKQLGSAWSSLVVEMARGQIDGVKRKTTKKSISLSR